LKMKMEDFLTQNKETEQVEPNKVYKLMGVRLEGKGPFIREEKLGAHIGAQRLMRVRGGDFVYSRLFAWRGAFGIIAPEMDGAYVSNEFPNFGINEGIVHPKYLELYFKQKRVWREVEKYCVGTTKASRNRFKERFLLDLEIPIPSINLQKAIARKIEDNLKEIQQVTRLEKQSIVETETIMDSVLTKILTKSIDNEWKSGPLSDFAEINPSRRGKTEHLKSMNVTFVPMASVDDITGKIVNPIVKHYEEVSKGFTWFQEGDIIFAKITPCMQNGKAAVAEKLENGVGFGSTEFHVLRPHQEVMSQWIYYLVRHKDFREDAKRHFKGTAGQQRVPQSFLESKIIVVPPIEEQITIVNFLKTLEIRINELRNAQSEIEKEIGELFPSILEGSFANE
jgi:type I restriction enzyme S subunit